MQREDGTIVTAYYTNTDLNIYYPEAHYYMGVLRWDFHSHFPSPAPKSCTTEGSRL